MSRRVELIHTQFFHLYSEHPRHDQQMFLNKENELRYVVFILLSYCIFKNYFGIRNCQYAKASIDKILKVSRQKKY